MIAGQKELMETKEHTQKGHD